MILLRIILSLTVLLSHNPSIYSTYSGFSVFLTNWVRCNILILFYKFDDYIEVLYIAVIPLFLTIGATFIYNKVTWKV